MYKKKEEAKPEKLAVMLPQYTFDELVATLMEESPLENTGAKLLLAETVAAMRFELRAIIAKQKVENLRVDEVRSIPALASNIRRNLETLGTTKLQEEELDF